MDALEFALRQRIAEEIRELGYIDEETVLHHIAMVGRNMGRRVPEALEREVLAQATKAR